MRPETRRSLADIIDACETIFEIAGPNGDKVLEDRTAALAVERLLLVLGEALVRVRDGEENVLEMISEWRAIVGMRNAIVHGYDTIEPSRVRDAVNEDLPLLASEARELLDWPF